MKLAGRKRSSFEVFAAAHSAGLIKLGLMVSGDRGRAEDAAQEALVRVYQRWSRLNNPLAYAQRTVVNRTRDDWRRVQRATRAHEDAGRLASLDEARGVLDYFAPKRMGHHLAEAFLDRFEDSAAANARRFHTWVGAALAELEDR